MRNIIIIGMQKSGKSTLATRLARKYDLYVKSVADLSEKHHALKTGRHESRADIRKQQGETYLRALESEVINMLSTQKLNNTVIDTTATSPLSAANRLRLSELGPVIWIDLNPKINFTRILSGGLPAYQSYHDNPQQIFDEQLLAYLPHYRQAADLILRVNNDTENQMLHKFVSLFEQKSTKYAKN